MKGIFLFYLINKINGLFHEGMEGKVRIQIKGSNTQKKIRVLQVSCISKINEPFQGIEGKVRKEIIVSNKYKKITSWTKR